MAVAMDHEPCFFLTARKIFFWGVSLAWLSVHTSNTQRQTHLSSVGHHYRCGDWSTERTNVLLQESEGWPLNQVHTALENYQGVWFSFSARENVKPIALRAQELSPDVFPIWIWRYIASSAFTTSVLEWTSFHNYFFWINLQTFSPCFWLCLKMEIRAWLPISTNQPHRYWTWHGTVLIRVPLSLPDCQATLHNLE